MKTSKTYKTGTVETRFVQREFAFDGFDGSEYVLLPACAYDGNKFDSLPKKYYPPIFERDEATVDMPLTISDVPRLDKDGSGKIEVTTGDLATPCIGIFDKKRQKAHFVFTIQGFHEYEIGLGGSKCRFRNFGLTYETGKLTISWPSARERQYRHVQGLIDERDEGVRIPEPDKIDIPYQYLIFDCADIPQFLTLFLTNRKAMSSDRKAMGNGHFSRAGGFDYDNILKILDDKYYARHSKFKKENGFETPGWCSSFGFTAYAFLKLGHMKTAKTALKYFDAVFSGQADCGLLCGKGKDGKATGGWPKWKEKGWDDLYGLRCSADALFRIHKVFGQMTEKQIKLKKKYIDGARKLADYFVRLWDKYGQFGQFVNNDTGDIVIGNSSSAVIAIAGLCESYKFFGGKNYLRVAELAGDYYYENFLKKGYTAGGPLEILQSPDSESAIALLESYVTLYETTKGKKWLGYAETAAALVSTWVVSYNYEFPVHSMLYRLRAKTIGTVFASVTNKHSAPGFCTSSGDCIYRLYKHTGNELYLDLIKDSANAIAQFISTHERPFYAGLNGCAEGLAPYGFVNERVNMSDWENDCSIGEVFSGHDCWSSLSLLLTIADLREILEGVKKDDK